MPKNANKQTKYIAFLTSYLSLTESQAAQAKTIFAAAAAAEASLKSSIKSSRKSLGASVRNNDGQGISQISSAIGSLSAQRHVIGANANAAFFAMLTSGQQAKLSQFRS